MALEVVTLQHSENGIDVSGAKRKPSQQRPAIKRRRLASDTLAWTDTSLPDRLEDYEGFFGLEEVDGVAVHKDDATGEVQFALNTPHSLAANGPKSTTDNARATNLEAEAEWAGFDDEVLISPSKPATLYTEGLPRQSENREKYSRDQTRPQQTKRTCSKDGKKPAKIASRQSSRQERELNVSVLPAVATINEGSEISIAAWKPLKLSPDTLAALASLGFSQPTPIQLSAIPEILSGSDVIGKASTGSGKTLAFGIPILERFLEFKGPKAPKTPLALILSPTRELAHQLEKHLTALCSSGIFEGPRITTLTGGLSIQKQQRLVIDADIIIGTPGRLWEVISASKPVAQAIKQIKFLVVDEADRLLSEGHFKEVEEILNALDRTDDGIPYSEDAPTPESSRQTLVFSATLDRELQRKLYGKSQPGRDSISKKDAMEYLLSKLNFSTLEPKYIDMNPIHQLASGLKESLIECGGTEKDLYLYALLLMHSNMRTLVFTNSISAVRRLAPFLQLLDLSALPLHSGMPQKSRLRSIERFAEDKDSKKPSASILVATDVAARGLDIRGVQLVIHYHLPRAADTYVHRSGRTARAGQRGSSILLCAPDEVAGVRRLIAKVHAQSAATRDQSLSEAAKQGYYMRTLDIDRRIVSRLRPRAALAKQLADMTIAKEKGHKEDHFMRAAAEELGVEYNSEEFEKQSVGKQARGSGRKKKERAARETSKGESSVMRAELRAMLQQRVNVGVSERYLTSGSVNVAELLRQQETSNGKTGDFLGSVNLDSL